MPARERKSGAEVVVSDPDGTVVTSVELSGTRVTVGRLPDVNDIALQPDPELLVTRAGHLRSSARARAGSSSTAAASTGRSCGAAAPPSA